ncbi:MAG: XRE family transcriptional regulator [Curvibacter sp.]|nr:MAG: XRE family transcriptional regulator [Curvibacter sp.]
MLILTEEWNPAVWVYPFLIHFDIPRQVVVALSAVSRYELGVHEPPLPTARLIAHAMGAPLTYLYCEDDKVAALLLALHQMKPAARDRKVAELLGLLS